MRPLSWFAQHASGSVSDDIISDLGQDVSDYFTELESTVTQNSFPQSVLDKTSAGGTSAAAQGADAQGPDKNVPLSNIPPNSDPEITFISGVNSSLKVAGTAFATWNGNDPATYSGSSDASKWGSLTPGTSGGTVTYWFQASSNWTTAEQNALLSGLALWSAEVNITFVQAANAGAANLTFERGAAGSGAFTSFPNRGTVATGSSTETSPGAGVYISIDTSQPYWEVGSSFNTAGGYAYETLVHEEGHVLGLGHGGPYNGTVDPSTQQFGPYDTRLWSLMSYINPFDSTAQYYNQSQYAYWGISPDGYYEEPTTPMILDIEAAQRIYGAATSGPLANGGVHFGFHTNLTGLIARYFDFTVDTNPVVTLYAGGTNNTLDLSGWSTGSTVNLNPGTFSSANNDINNISIADNTVISSFIGTTGNDDVTLNPNYTGTYTGDGGNDIFRSTEFGLFANTFTDLGVGDKLNFTDASLSTFSYHKTDEGQEISYGSYLLFTPNQPIGHIVESTDPKGGVDLTVMPHDPSLMDFSGDGSSDLLWLNNNGQLIDWNMNGSVVANSSPVTYNGQPIDVGSQYSYLGTGDFWGWGSSDVLWEDTSGEVAFWTMNGSAVDPSNSGLVYLNSSVVDVASSYKYLGAGNFQGVGSDDVLWENSNGNIAYWDMIGRSINPGDSGNVTYAGSTVSIAPTYTYLGTGNFYGEANNDTHSDVLWENSNGQLALWRMNGSAIDTGKSGAVTYNGSVVAVASSYTYLGIGDFYGNGSSGVLWENSNGQVALWSMNGTALNAAQSGSVVDTSNNVVGVSSDWHFLRVGDFKDDGTYNVVWQNNNGQLAYWDMQGRTLLGATSGLVTYNGSPIAVSPTYTGLHS